jgi:hypothetical protein
MWCHYIALIYSLFISLIYCGWKYCSLVYCERKTLLDDCWFGWIAQTNRVLVIASISRESFFLGLQMRHLNLCNPLSFLFHVHTWLNFLASAWTKSIWSWYNMFLCDHAHQQTICYHFTMLKWGSQGASIAWVDSSNTARAQAQALAQVKSNWRMLLFWITPTQTWT